MGPDLPPVDPRRHVESATPVAGGGSRAHRSLLERIGRFGSIRFDEYLEVVLYDQSVGFFTDLGRGGRGRAGRADGDFITSPEVGPLFGAVVARYLDHRWEQLGRPDPFVVVEAGAGRGSLAISVLAGAPTCAPALRYVLVERSAGLRSRQGDHLALAHPFDVLGPPGDADEGIPAPDAGTGPLVCSLPGLPAEPVDGVVIANELLDNVPFRLFERSVTGWSEVRVGVDADLLVELLVPAADDDVSERLELLAPDARVGSRIPLQDGAVVWLRDALGVIRRGSVLVFDYTSPLTSSLADRPAGEWLRTYRGHERGRGPLHDAGEQDVTVDVCIDQLATVAAPDTVLTQADWLRRHGIQGMVEEGRRMWNERAGVGDLAALAARSRSVEAEALCDPTGLGAFHALEWHTPAP